MAGEVWGTFLRGEHRGNVIPHLPVLAAFSLNLAVQNCTQHRGPPQGLGPGFSLRAAQAPQSSWRWLAFPARVVEEAVGQSSGGETPKTDLESDLEAVLTCREVEVSLAQSRVMGFTPVWGLTGLEEEAEGAWVFEAWCQGGCCALGRSHVGFLLMCFFFFFFFLAPMILQ